MKKTVKVSIYLFCMHDSNSDHHNGHRIRPLWNPWTTFEGDLYSTEFNKLGIPSSQWADSWCCAYQLAQCFDWWNFSLSFDIFGVETNQAYLLHHLTFPLEAKQLLLSLQVDELSKRNPSQQITISHHSLQPQNI